jgi:DNA-binding beta-propeller fold protein YncE
MRGPGMPALAVLLGAGLGKAAGEPSAFPNPAPVGAQVLFRADPVPGARYAWDFGDGTPPADGDTAATASHRYAAPGRYPALVRTLMGGASRSSSFYVLIHPGFPARRPAASATIAVDGPRRRVFVVNPDHGTVACVDADKLELLWEAPSGPGPAALAQAPDGAIWVANRGDATLALLDPAAGARLATIKLPFASAPSGLVFHPDGSSVYVALEAAARVARIDAAARTVTAMVLVPPHPRGLAVDAEGKRILVAHFLSRGFEGKVTMLDAASLAPLREISLGEDLSPDTEIGGRGSPNHLAAVAISPDGSQAWIPAKKDNLRRGAARDGLPLDFQNTVRALVMRIDMATGKERVSLRLDFDDSEGPCAVAFGPWGFPALIAFRGSGKVVAWDPYGDARVTTLPDVGEAPMGLVVDSATGRLFVHAFLSRDLAVFDARALVAGSGTAAPLLKRVPTAAAEPLPMEVLRGKRIFNKSADIRMGKDGYLSCASCHADGGSDGRVWDFTDRGEGLRSTVPLPGRARQGPLHWSANFDEVQDFEHDMRGPFGGLGFLADAEFNAGTRGRPLGDKKAGLSPELDALAAYVASLDKVPPSPWRNPDGSYTEAARRGKAIFFRADVGCARCHAPPDLSDSQPAGGPARPPSPDSADAFTAEGFLIHDVGTLRPQSGKRLGGPLAGLDTPGLKGLWDSAPYLHDGSAATLEEVLTTANPQDRHGRTSGLPESDRNDLIAFLEQLDDLDAEGKPDGLRPAEPGRPGWRILPQPRGRGGWRIRVAGAAPGLTITISLRDARGRRLRGDATLAAARDGTAEWEWDGTGAGSAPVFARACSEHDCRSAPLARVSAGN